MRLGISEKQIVLKYILKIALKTICFVCILPFLTDTNRKHAMREQTWVELQLDAPLAVNACLHYFQQRYANWQAKLLDIEAIVAYLNTKGLEVLISTFGIPNRTDWYYEVYYDGSLLQHERDFTTYELAATTAITMAFQHLECHPFPFPGS